jgi:DNA-binding NtrC family response regulator
MVGEQILVVEPDQALRAKLADYLDAQGYQVDAVEDGDGAVAMLRNKVFDVVLTDLQLIDGLHGLEMVRHVRGVAPSTIVLIMTAHGTVRSAVEAFRSGAHDYLVKPFSLIELGEKIANVIQYRRLIHENGVLRQEVHKQQESHPLLVGKSQAVRELTGLILKIAPCSCNVLITGESGTGKELVARSLHQNSQRKGLFVPLNVAAIPESLIESYLFGHIRGAFTGADQAREGVFRTAADGTLFLDEIGELPLAQQAKLLRALEAREVQPVGSDTSVKVTARVVAATNRDLKKMVAEGSFREDLLFRLNVVNLQSPPLRQHVEDIPALVRHFIARHRRDMGIPVSGIDNKAMQCLMSYGWKGNVRELSNVIERAMLLCEGDMLGVEDLPAELRTGAELWPQNLNDAVQRVQYRHILSVLETVNGNRELAAKLLGLSPATLYRLMEKLGLKGYKHQPSASVAYL